MAQELGEDFDGVQKLRDLVTFLPDVDPFIGFGESAPVDGVTADNVESQVNRRVEVLFFAKGQEPDLALLAEDPKASELYLPEVFVREEIDLGATNPHRGIAAPLRIWLLDEERKRMGAMTSSSFVLEKTFGAPYRLVLPDGEVRLGYAKEDGMATEYHLPSRAIMRLSWGRALPAEDREELPELENLAHNFFRYRTTVVVEDGVVPDPAAGPLANMGLFGTRDEQLATFGKFYDDGSENNVLRVHRKGTPA